MKTTIVKIDNKWQDEFGAIYSADKIKLIKAPINIKSYDILPGTKIIFNGAFFSRENLLSVSIPDSVVVIDEGAFYCCWGFNIYHNPKFC